MGSDMLRMLQILKQQTIRIVIHPAFRAAAAQNACSAACRVCPQRTSAERLAGNPENDVSHEPVSIAMPGSIFSHEDC